MDLRNKDSKGRTICPECKTHYFPELGERRHPGVTIQQEFPNALPWQREQLLSGICSDKCWDNYVGVPDDDAEELASIAREDRADRQALDKQEAEDPTNESVTDLQDSLPRSG